MSNMPIDYNSSILLIWYLFFYLQINILSKYWYMGIKLEASGEEAMKKSNLSNAFEFWFWPPQNLGWKKWFSSTGQNFDDQSNFLEIICKTFRISIY